MIRHSSALFIALVFHLLLAFLIYKLFVLYKEPPIITEKRVKVQLCNIAQAKKVVLPLNTPKKKKIIPKIEKQKVQKLAPIIKPKPVIKKIESIIEKKILPVKKEPIIPSPTLEKILPVNNAVLVNKETLEEKNIRLEKDYLDVNIQKISSLLSEYLYYPRSARKRGITGIVLVKFKLSTLGQVHSIKVLSSSSEILERAAIQTIEDIQDKFPTPSEELTLHVPIEYKLSK